VRRLFPFWFEKGKCERKPFRLEPEKQLSRNRCTLDAPLLSFEMRKMWAKIVSLRTGKKFQANRRTLQAKPPVFCYKLLQQILNMRHNSSRNRLEGYFLVMAGGTLDFPLHKVYPAQWFDPRTITEFALTVRAAKSHKIGHVPHSYFTILLIRPKSLASPSPFPYF
jgi:hypothetical protein